jgi:hypothetical protein
LQQQDVIRTELIPGHCGDRDVDELVMFIDGDRSKTVETRINHSTDSNSQKAATSRRKTRKTSKLLSASDNQQDDMSVNHVDVIHRTSNVSMSSNQLNSSHSNVNSTRQAVNNQGTDLAQSDMTTIIDETSRIVSSQLNKNMID